jgi:hypothetical protein
MKQQAPAAKEWDLLTDNLAACLADLSEDEFLILSAKRANYFVQFAAQGQFGMRIEAASNVYVSPPEAVLAANAYSAMANLGWKSPTGVPGSEPRDPDGSPNFFLDLALPVHFRRVADMAVKTLREVYCTPHPGQLQYKSFDSSGIEIRFPNLRLKREEVQSQARSNIQRGPRNPHLHGVDPVDPTETIVEVGAEGGSLMIEGKDCGDSGWQFRMVHNEMGLDDEEPYGTAPVHEQTDYLDSLGEALRLFDKYPYWIDLCVIEVHPDFVDEVLAEVRSRGGTSTEARWREALDFKHRQPELNGYEESRVIAPESIIRQSQARSPGQEVDIAVARKYERDVDLLLAEEFAVSPSFAAWFLEQTHCFQGIQAHVVEVGVSRSDATGESDLVVIFERQDGRNRFALHIEDKINAPLQPEQETRYRLRADRAVQKGLYSAFEVILCCPKAYPLTHAEASRFDSCVHYEAVSEFLNSQGENDAHSAYRARFVAKAAQTGPGTTWVPEPDCVTNLFWQAAFEIARTEFPELEMQEPHFTKGQTWVGFRPLDMPTQPRRIYIDCKGTFGQVDLKFSTCLARLFQPMVSAVLEKDMYVLQAGRSVAIRIEVPSFEICEPNDEALVKVRTAFSACVRLIRFYRQNRMLLDEAATASVPQA